MDNLKKYLQDHREELDSEIPDEAVWNRVLQQAPATQSRGKVRAIVMILAAAACILGVIAITVNRQTKPKGNESPQLANTATGRAEKILSPTVTQPGQDTFLKKGTWQPENIPNESPKKPERVNPGDTDPSGMVDALERNYVQLVNLQLNNIRQTPVFMEGPDYFNDFKVQLRQMDKDEALLRKDIRVSGLNNILLEQLINIYQQKLNLLKDLLTEINKINNQVKQKSLPSDSLKTSFIKI